MPGATINPKSDSFEIARWYLSPRQYQLFAFAVVTDCVSTGIVVAISWYCWGLRYSLAISKQSLFGFMVAPGI